MFVRSPRAHFGGAGSHCDSGADAGSADTRSTRRSRKAAAGSVDGSAGTKRAPASPSRKRSLNRISSTHAATAIAAAALGLAPARDEGAADAVTSVFLNFATQVYSSN